MKSILTEIDRRVPFPLLLIIMFICLDLLIYFLIDLLLTFTEHFFFRNEPFQPNIQTLFALLIGKSISLIVIILSLRSNFFKLDSCYSSSKYGYKNIGIAIIISVTFILVLKYEIVNIFTTFFGEIQANLIYWPNPIFKPSSYHISYLILFTLIFLILKPLWEEIIFRRILIATLMKRGFNQIFAIILSSLIFSFYLLIYILVEVSFSDLSWYLITSISSGLLLGSIYVKTERIKFSFLVSSLSNFFLLFIYLSVEHFEFIPYREIILLFSLVPVLFTILIISYYIIRKYLDQKISISSLKENLNSNLLISWPKSLKMKNYLYTIFLILPIIPFGSIIFIDHTILFVDIWAKLIQNGLIIILLILILFYSYSSIHQQLGQYTDNETNLLTINLTTIKAKVKSINKESLNNFFRVFFSQIAISIIIIGILSPFYILSVSSLTKIEIIIIWQALVDVKITIAQNPFFTFQHIINEIRSNIVFIGNKTEEIYQFLPFQQSLGKWNFLPDTYMASEADWIHGLVTVVIWFIIIIFCIYIIQNGKKYPLKTILGVVLLVVLNFFWILLVLGLGSISEQGGPSTIPSLNQTSLLLQFNISVKEFMILPIGLIFLLIGAILIAIQYLYRKNRLERRK